MANFTELHLSNPQDPKKSKNTNVTKIAYVIKHAVPSDQAKKLVSPRTLKGGKRLWFVVNDQPLPEEFLS